MSSPRPVAPCRDSPPTSIALVLSLTVFVAVLALGCRPGPALHPSGQARGTSTTPAGAPDCPWEVETVDSAGSVGSFAVDGAGGVHMSYLVEHREARDGNVLKYAYRPAGGSWTTTAVGREDARDAVLAVDGGGGVHLAYSPVGGGVKYAHRAGRPGQ